MALDMTTIARFLVLPGAEQLVEAFSRIPPGPLRDSVVSHAQVIADTYSAAPAAQQMPDPLLMASTAPQALTAPPEPPPQQRPVARTPQEEVVRLRLQTSLAEHEIAERVGLPLGEVVAELRRAREAGLSFPPRGKPAKPAKAKSGPAFAVTVEELTAMGLSHATRAASQRYITVEAYMQRRKQAIEMAQQGAPLEQIVKATSENEKVLSNWFSLARGAGYAVPYVHNGPQPATVALPDRHDDGPRYDLAEDEDDDTEAYVAPPAVYPPPYAEMPSQAQHKVREIAEAEGLSPEQFQDRQRQIIKLRQEGVGPQEIVAQLGLRTKWSVVKTLQRAKAAGVEFPDLPHWRAAQVEEEALPPEPEPELPPEPAVWPLPFAQQDWRGQKSTKIMANSASLTIEQQQAREADVIRRLKAGEYPVQIMEALGLQDHTIRVIRNRAVKDGVRLPTLRKGAGAAKALGRPHGLSGFMAARAAEKAAREAQDAPEAQEPAAPSRHRAPVRFPLFVDELVDGAGRLQTEQAAERLGATLEGYMALRRSAVAMFIRGVRPSEVAAELELEPKMVANWYHTSLAAGRQIVSTPAQPLPLQDQASEAAPRAAAAPEPPAPHVPPDATAARTPPPEPAPTRSPAAAEVPNRREAPRGFWTEVASVPERGRAMAEQAAREMGLTFEEYAAVRRRALELFRKGFLPAHVASELKLTHKQASNWRDRMKGAGLLQFSGSPLIANDTTDDVEQEEQTA